MTSNPRSRSWLGLPLGLPFLALVALLVAALPSQASVNTVYSCAPSGHSGNHDAIFNGFFVQGVPAINLHSVTLYYTTDTSGTYTLMLTARRGSYTGQQIGLTQVKTVTLSSSADTAVTWDFGDATIVSGSNLYFTHSQSGGPGGVQFNLQPNLCPGDVENVGTSNVNNGLSVAVTITQNVTTTGCLATNQILCVDDQPGDRRFRVTVTYATSQAGGKSGSGQAINLSSLGVNRGGLFWFFDPTNPELLVKVLNGCPINQRFWVYYSAGTNVGLTVTVTDTTTGNSKTYTNPDLTAAPPVQDTNALSCS